MSYHKDSIFLDDALDLVTAAFYNELKSQRDACKSITRDAFEEIAASISDDPYLRMDVSRSERLVKKVLNSLGITIKG